MEVDADQAAPEELGGEAPLAADAPAARGNAWGRLLLILAISVPTGIAIAWGMVEYHDPMNNPAKLSPSYKQKSFEAFE